jgi:hypothetical protein
VFVSGRARRMLIGPAESGSIQALTLASKLSQPPPLKHPTDSSGLSISRLTGRFGGRHYGPHQLDRLPFRHHPKVLTADRSRLQHCMCAEWQTLQIFFQIYLSHFFSFLALLSPTEKEPFVFCAGYFDTLVSQPVAIRAKVINLRYTLISCIRHLSLI